MRKWEKRTMKQQDKTRQDTQAQIAPPHDKKPFISLAPTTSIMIFLALVLAIFSPSSLNTPMPAATAHPPTLSTSTAPPLLTPTPTAMPTPSPIAPFPTTFAQQLEVMQAKGRYFSHGNTQLPEIALTFDDGPHDVY